MKYDPEVHRRRSIRLAGHDYAGGGVYFVTICAHRDAIAAAGGKPFEGELRRLIEERLRITAEKFPQMILGEWIIMPDHFHALIRMRPGKLKLGDLIGGFKAAVAREWIGKRRRHRNLGRGRPRPYGTGPAPPGLRFQCGYGIAIIMSGLCAPKRRSGGLRNIFG